MYLNSLYYQNVGPISNLKFDFKRNSTGVPCPLVIVGQNGSGKSILLSNIVDAFYEFAGIVYNNATEPDLKGYQYYKEISPTQIQVGKKYMVAHLHFSQEERKLEYIFKSGELSYNDYKALRGGNCTTRFDWGDENNYKNVLANEKDVTDIFEKSVVCYFSPSRYMKPYWMGEKYFESNNIEAYSTRARYNKQLNNPITAENISNLTLQWLFDVITDSRADLRKADSGTQYTISFPPTDILDLLSISRINIEKLISTIMGEKVIFRMKNRSYGKRRFSICRECDDSVVAPSLDALSTGQLALFNLFATIIRYADVENIDFSHRLSEISGIVIIDEIELHLHAKLQREVLPKLIALFPKVQFIITSHSPLFLMGMQEQFGDDGFSILELPSGNKISTEQFSEFENAYNYFSESQKHQEEIRNAISKQTDCSLIITEGATDWKHMKAAYNALRTDPRCSDWLPNLQFEFLEYEPKNSSTESSLKLEMGASQLKVMCEQYCIVRNPRKMIFVADADVKEINKSFGVNGQTYKSWGNNVYSLVIPTPEHRKETPNICIEHYYTDEQLKTSMAVEGTSIKQRIYIGNEFDSDGISLDRTTFCSDRNKCGPQKISIIDGHKDGARVYAINDKEKENLALSKMKFANAILNRTAPYDHMDFSSFIHFFEIIKEILEE